MKNNLIPIEALEAMVPITRFNKGEAGRIFEEVEKSGMKVAIKNHKPACILLSIQDYKEIIEMMEDYKLLLEAQRRLEETDESEYISHEDMMKSIGVKADDLNDVEVEIE